MLPSKKVPNSIKYCVPMNLVQPIRAVIEIQFHGLESTYSMSWRARAVHGLNPLFTMRIYG